jgi:hypothetical protein
MKMFAFGCSFTQYAWPTWADIAGREFGSYENWGKGGAGNQFIFNSLIECLVKNKISKNDTVIIMWSGVTREDRYINKNWVTLGNIFSYNVNDENFKKNFSDFRGCCIRDFNTIFATQNILKSIGCKFYFLSMTSLTDFGNQNVAIEDLLFSFKPALDQVRPSVHEIVFNFDWTSRPFNVTGQENGYYDKQFHYNQIKDLNWPEWQATDLGFVSRLSNKIKKECFESFGLDLYENVKKSVSKINLPPRVDYHPTPLEHLEYLEKVLPEISISNSTKDWVTSMDESVKLVNCKRRHTGPTRW